MSETDWTVHIWSDLGYIARFRPQYPGEKVYTLAIEVFSLVAGPNPALSSDDPASYEVWMKGYQRTGDWIPATQLDDAEPAATAICKRDGQTVWALEKESLSLYGTQDHEDFCKMILRAFETARGMFAE